MRTWGRIPLGKFLAAELIIQYPVKSFAPYLGGRRGRVPSDSLRKFLQEVNLYNSFKLLFFHLLNRKDGTKATTTLVKRIGGDKDLFINELRVVLDIPKPKNPKDDII